MPSVLFCKQVNTMSTNELEAKIRELRQLQSLIEEAQAVSTGLLDILLPVRSLAALERAVQNEGEVTRLSERYGAVGVHMFCPHTPDAAAHCRNFASCTPSRRRRPPVHPMGR
jgi:predicted PhzF superfamily epimerase YddE/YHI9